MYTMTSWEEAGDAKVFATSGQHREVMKHTRTWAHEVRTAYVDADEFPSWTEAKKLLEGNGM